MKLGFLLNKWSSSGIVMLVLLALPLVGQANTTGKAMSLESAIQQISAQYNVYFTYNKKLIEDYTVDYEVDLALTLDVAVDKVLSQTTLKYKIQSDKYVIIYKSDREGIQSLKEMAIHLEELIDSEEKINQKSVAYLPTRPLLNQSTVGEKRLVINVSGKVTSISGEPLIGVNVLVKGTDKGTATDFDGNFILDDIDENAILLISYIGYQSKEIAVAGKTSITIILQEDSQTLDEVVVVGYGTQKKSDLTGAVSRAAIEKFKESPNPNILQSLSGAVSGLSIGKTNESGEEPSIQIRGQSTLNGNKNPLIVVDGIIYRGAVGDLNPNNIKSVDILKDASSKAIYGAQATNGVILITTKIGENNQKPIFSFSTYYSSQTPSNRLHTLNRDQFIQAAKDVVWKEAYLAPEYIQDNPDFNIIENVVWGQRVLEGYENGTDYNWMKNSTSSGHIYNANLSISGGSENFSYLTSFNFNNQEGWVINDRYKRKNGRINLKYSITDWFTVGTNTFGSFTDFSGVAPNFGTLVRMPSLITPYDDNGELVIYPTTFSNTNPFLTNTSDDRDNRNQLMSKIYSIINVPGVEGLTYQINFSNNYGWDPHSYANEYSAGLLGSAYSSFSSSSGFVLDNIITYNKTLQDHNFNVTLVAGSEKRRGDSFRAEGTDFESLLLSYNSLEVAGNHLISSNSWEESFLYQMGRLNYNFQNTYFLTGTIRRDGYSGFAMNNKTGLFPSVGLGWMLSNENFLENNNKINLLKLRASYGVNGNTPTRYSSLARVSRKASYVKNGETVLGQFVSSLPNPNLSWELTKSLNFGLDFGLMNDRMYGSVEYYNSTTTDLLWNLVLPEITGFPSIITNLGKIANNGVEINLNAGIIQSRNFDWSASLYFDRNRNEIQELIGLDSDEDGQEDDLIASGLFIGKSIGAIYAYDIQGIWQIDEMDQIPSSTDVGMYKYEDVNGDGEITPESDRQFLGRTEPSYSFGLQNSLSYKNFNLNIFIKSIQGGRNSFLKLNEPDHRGGENSTDIHTWFVESDNWTPSNSDARFLRQGGEPPLDALQHGHYQSRSFIRLQDISLSYQFESKKIEKLGFSNLKVYVSGKDLITLTDWLGWDPETGQGLVIGGYPVMKGVSFGIDFQF